jgi:hypothetical protein
MGSDNIQGFRTLEAWKHAEDFALVIYKFTSFMTLLNALFLLPIRRTWSINVKPTRLPRPK